jgi:hypothetical protein
LVVEWPYQIFSCEHVTRIDRSKFRPQLFQLDNIDNINNINNINPRTQIDP